MYALQEALARERQRELQHYARQGERLDGAPAERRHRRAVARRQERRARH